MYLSNFKFPFSVDIKPEKSFVIAANPGIKRNHLLIKSNGYSSSKLYKKGNLNAGKNVGPCGINRYIAFFFGFILLNSVLSLTNFLNFFFIIFCKNIGGPIISKNFRKHINKKKLLPKKSKDINTK